MLLSFIGAPCSGKTTVAALVFAALKDAGQAVEFVPEKAREYIAEYRVKHDQFPPQSVTLTDVDQLAIMHRQVACEENFSDACSQSIIVADSSPLNTLLYMSEETRQLAEVKDLVRIHLSLNPTVLYCPPLSSSYWPYDPGRIHDEPASRAVDQSIASLILPLLPSPATTLFGHIAQLRANQVLNIVWTKLGEAINDHPAP